jgi:hypothetical protein
MSRRSSMTPAARWTGHGDRMNATGVNGCQPVPQVSPSSSLSIRCSTSGYLPAMLHRRQFLSSIVATASGYPNLSLLAAQSPASAVDALPVSPWDSLAGAPGGPWRRLFLDGSIVEQQSGVTKEFHSAQKHSANPMIVADQIWEGKSAIIGPYVYGTILREGQTLRMWYQLLHEGNHIGYAESQDGIRWVKPRLPYVKYRGSVETNLVVSAFSPRKPSDGLCHNPSVIPLSPSPDPMRRYALYGFDPHAGGPRVAYSPNGLAWHYPALAEIPPLFPSSDVLHFFYDPYQAAFFSTWKTRNRRGRAVGIAKSTDGVHWQKTLDGPIFGADDQDPDDTQIYGMPVFAYQGMYLGLPWIYRARYYRYGDYSVDKMLEAQQDSPRTMEPQLAWSWDLIQWTRPPHRSALIPRGDTGQWDAGMTVTARAPVEMDDQLYFYYGGTDRPHDEKQLRSGIGLATLRLDGFCSMRSQPTEEGWLITRREPMLEPSVTINGRTFRGGSITAEILDRRFQVIPGFSRTECIPFQGDATRHRLQWRTSTFGQHRPSPDARIRFWLQHAELFSYLPTVLDPKEPDLARMQPTGP